MEEETSKIMDDSEEISDIDGDMLSNTDSDREDAGTRATSATTATATEDEGGRDKRTMKAKRKTSTSTSTSTSAAASRRSKPQPKARQLAGKQGRRASATAGSSDVDVDVTAESDNNNNNNNDEEIEDDDEHIGRKLSGGSGVSDRGKKAKRTKAGSSSTVVATKKAMKPDSKRTTSKKTSSQRKQIGSSATTTGTEEKSSDGDDEDNDDVSLSDLEADVHAALDVDIEDEEPVAKGPSGTKGSTRPPEDMATPKTKFYGNPDYYDPILNPDYVSPYTEFTRTLIDPNDIDGSDYEYGKSKPKRKAKVKKKRSSNGSSNRNSITSNGSTDKDKDQANSNDTDEKPVSRGHSKKPSVNKRTANKSNKTHDGDEEDENEEVKNLISDAVKKINKGGQESNASTRTSTGTSSGNEDEYHEEDEEEEEDVTSSNKRKSKVPTKGKSKKSKKVVDEDEDEGDGNGSSSSSSSTTTLSEESTPEEIAEVLEVFAPKTADKEKDKTKMQALKDFQKIQIERYMALTAANSNNGGDSVDRRASVSTNGKEDISSANSRRDSSINSSATNTPIRRDSSVHTVAPITLTGKSNKGSKPLYPTILKIKDSNVEEKILLGKRLVRRELISKQDLSGQTYLHKYSASGSYADVYRLLEAGAEINIHDTAGWTPLHEACSHGHWEIVELLIFAGANVNAAGQDEDTPLHDALSAQDENIVERLLVHGALLNIPNSDGITAWDTADKTMKKKLIKFESFYNGLEGSEEKVDSNGNNRLHLACKKRNKRLVKHLLIAGHPLNSKNKEGETSLLISVKNNDIDIVELLIKFGANFNSLVPYAVRRDLMDYVRLFTRYGANLTSNYGASRKPLDELATSNKMKSLLESLQENIEKGEDRTIIRKPKFFQPIERRKEPMVPETLLTGDERKFRDSLKTDGDDGESSNDEKDNEEKEIKMKPKKESTQKRSVSNIVDDSPENKPKKSKKVKTDAGASTPTTGKLIENSTSTPVRNTDDDDDDKESMYFSTAKSSMKVQKLVVKDNEDEQDEESRKVGGKDEDSDSSDISDLSSISGSSGNVSKHPKSANSANASSATATSTTKKTNVKKELKTSAKPPIPNEDEISGNTNGKRKTGSKTSGNRSSSVGRQPRKGSITETESEAENDGPRKGRGGNRNNKALSGDEDTVEPEKKKLKREINGLEDSKELKDKDNFEDGLSERERRKLERIMQDQQGKVAQGGKSRRQSQVSSSTAPGASEVKKDRRTKSISNNSDSNEDSNVKVDAHGPVTPVKREVTSPIVEEEEDVSKEDGDGDDQGKTKKANQEESEDVKPAIGVDTLKENVSSTTIEPSGNNKSIPQSKLASPAAVSSTADESSLSSIEIDIETRSPINALGTISSASSPSSAVSPTTAANKKEFESSKLNKISNISMGTDEEAEAGDVEQVTGDEKKTAKVKGGKSKAATAAGAKDKENDSTKPNAEATTTPKRLFDTKKRSFDEMIEDVNKSIENFVPRYSKFVYDSLLRKVEEKLDQLR